jgi:uncharacterized OB-fold protein
MTRTETPAPESGDASGAPSESDLFCMLDDEPRLIASRCETCSEITFPEQPSCPRCASQSVARELVGPRGVLWTWTVQTFAPKPPFLAADPFEPFGVGYVELPGQLRVESRLTESDPSRLRIGLPMKLTLVDLPGHPNRTTFAFEPAEGQP